MPKNNVLIRAIMVLVLSVAYLLPLSSQAQIYYAPTVTYGQNFVSGSTYLLPNRGFPSGGSEQSSQYGGYSSSQNSRYLTSNVISVSCGPTRLNATTGQPVTWFSSVTGGNGSYIYTWNGTDGLSSNTSTVSKTYTTNGDKFATLSITSGNQLTTVSCGSVVIGAGTVHTVTVPGFGASCYATPERPLPGETVTWLSIVSGTTASTTYTWDGTDGLTGTRPLVSKTYTTNGIKSALLTVTDGTNRAVVACTNSASVGPRIVVVVSPVKPATPVATDIQGICVPSTTTPRPHDKVLWTVAAIGGNGTYEYLWSGDDALIATTASTTKTYDAPGTKNATVTILSGGKTKVLSCPSIEVTKGWSGLTASSLFGWMNSTFGYLLLLLLAIILAIILARRKQAKEEEEEKDHEH